MSVSFSATASATVGTATVTIQAIGGGVTHTTSLSLAVLPLSALGLDCAYGSQAEAAGPMPVNPPTSVTTSFPYSSPDFDGTLDTNCQATYVADTDAAFHPLVSDNPTAVVSAGSGGGFTVDVIAALNTVSSVNGFDISLRYDTNILRAVKIDQSGLIWGGAGLPVGASVLTLSLRIDNSNGVVRVAQVLVGAPQQTADVEMFRVRFDIIGASTRTPITPFNDVLTSPASVPHTTASTIVDTTSIYDFLAGTALNANATWSYAPNPAVPGSSLTFTATATCPGCTAPLSFQWDFSSNDAPGYVSKSQATTNPATVTAPPPVVNRVTLTITDAAAHSFAATRLLPLVLKETPIITSLNIGTAGGSWSANWLGGVTTVTSGYTGTWIFCPGSALVKTVCSNPSQTISQSGAGVTETTSAAAITYNYAGLYNATLKIADTPELQIGTTPSGNTAISRFLVNATGTTPAYTVLVSANTTSSGAGKPVNFAANATYASSYPVAFRARYFNYVFDFGDGSSTVTVSDVQVGQNASVTHIFLSSSLFTVKVVAQEDTKISAAAVSQIEENGFLQINGACALSGLCDFTITPSSLVAGASATFAATASGGSPPYIFSWDFGDGFTGTGATVSHTYRSAGTYNVVLSIQDNGGQIHTVKKTVTITQGGGGGGGFDIASILASPLGLGGIAAIILGILGGFLYLRHRGRRPAPIEIS